MIAVISFPPSPQTHTHTSPLQNVTGNSKWKGDLKSQNCAVPQNIHILPMESFLVFTPVPPGNSNLASYFASKILTFKTPLPLGISNDLPWGGYGFFLELYIFKGKYEAEIALLEGRGGGQSKPKTLLCNGYGYFLEQQYS